MSRCDSAASAESTERLHRHVLGPLRTASDAVATERAEIEHEIAAFDRFERRVEAVEPVGGAPRPATTLAERATDPSPTDECDQLRTAYRETVLSVDHYDRVYGESLVENVASELSPDVAVAFERDGVDFTRPFKAALLERVADAVTARETLLSVLDGESESLERATEGLCDALAAAGETPRLLGPDAEAVAWLETIAEERQSTVRSRPALSRYDSHDFCRYLYQSPTWSYPVLTAVARFRDSVVRSEP